MRVTTQKISTSKNINVQGLKSQGTSGLMEQRTRTALTTQATSSVQSYNEPPQNATPVRYSKDLVISDSHPLTHSQKRKMIPTPAGARATSCPTPTLVTSSSSPPSSPTTTIPRLLSLARIMKATLHIQMSKYPGSFPLCEGQSYSPPPGAPDTFGRHETHDSPSSQKAPG